MPYDLPPEPDVVRIPSGRAVSYYDIGDDSGTPVFAMHGTPACGAGFWWADERARERGVRLIAPDRPGVGRSDHFTHTQPLVADYAPELAATADALGIESFSVLGYSGGGPYALAAAHAMPDRVRALAVVAGAGHIGEWAKVNDYAPTDRRMTRLSIHAPLLAHAGLFVSYHACRTMPGMSARLANMELSTTDRAVMKQFTSPRAALALFTRACTRGTRGALVDYATLARPWGFRVENVTVPTRCWHATDDPLVPIRHSDELASRIPGATVDRWPGEGHLAIVEHVGEVLDWLALTGRGEVGRSDHAAQ
jgi:pimeloyl-ACP methyl ester carboxylesterase